MAYDGIQYGSRVDNFNLPKLYAKVVDNVLGAPIYYSRLMGMGKQFEGKTMDFTVDVVSDTQGEFFVGLETLNSAAVNSTISLSYAHTAFTQPQVSVMVESFANTGSQAIINLDEFKFDKAVAQAQQALGSSIFGSGTANQPNGLGNIVLDSGTIGGQSRTTYSALSATNTASGGTLTLAKMATLFDAASGSGAGLMQEEPTNGLTTPTVWSLYEQLLAPNVRASYEAAGFDKVAVRGLEIKRGSSELRNGQGFTVLSYRGIPLMKDSFATSGVLFFLNENYFGWRGRSVVPEMYKPFVEKVNLGTMASYEGTAKAALDLPSEYNGWFYQKPMILPTQAGIIARFYVIGQTCGWGFRRLAKLTGVTSV